MMYYITLSNEIDAFGNSVDSHDVLSGKASYHQMLRRLEMARLWDVQFDCRFFS